jgi:hypothetical protein
MWFISTYITAIITKYGKKENDKGKIGNILLISSLISSTFSGWHRFSYYGQISTTPVVAGQCGSSAPIYLQGMKINGSLVYGVQLLSQMRLTGFPMD